MKVSGRTLQAVACFIAGEERDRITEITEHFRYRSGSELQMFFERADLDFTFDGSARYYWVLRRLGELNDGTASDPALPANGLKRVIEQTVHRDEISSDDDWESVVDRINKELARDGLAVVYTEQMVNPKVVSAGLPFLPGSGAFSKAPFPRAEPAQPLIMRPRFRRRTAAKDVNLGFVFMPFESDFNDVLSEAIHPAIEENGLDCQRADDIQNNEEIMEDIWEAIWTCRIVVADLTDENPNVFYEVGVADTVGKEVVLIAQKGRLGRTPFDVSARRVIFYNNDNPGRKKLREKLADMIRAVLAKAPADDMEVTPDRASQDDQESLRAVEVEGAPAYASEESPLGDERLRQLLCSDCGWHLRHECCEWCLLRPEIHQ